MAIADKLVNAIVQYGGDSSKALDAIQKEHPGISGDKAMQEFKQRRVGGVEGSSMAQENMEVILPHAKSLKWALRMIKLNGGYWFALVVWDVRGFLNIIPVKRLSERVFIFDEEADMPEDGTRPTRYFSTNEDNAETAQNDWIGPDELACLTAYLEKHGGRKLHLDKVHQLTGPSTDGQQTFARKPWSYTVSDDKAAYESSMLYLIENWEAVVKGLSAEQKKQVEDALKAQGVDLEKVFGKKTA